MIKTEQAIEGDFFKIIKGSVLGKAIRGSVYRPDMRPKDARGEDIVVKFLSGRDEQLQKGVVIVNIYVPDIIRKDGTRVRDMTRIDELEALVMQTIGEDKTDYWFETENTPTLIHHEEIDQYCINVRLNIQRIAY